MTKVCTKCKRRKEIKHFARTGKSEGCKYMARCKKCTNEWAVAYRKRPEVKQRVLQYNRAYYGTPEMLARRAELRAQRRLEVLIHYGGKQPSCRCCKERQVEFLTIDHINGGGYQHKKKHGIGSIYLWLRVNNYPKGYRVLCFNCNLSRAIYGECPHGNGI